jgi:hypothetical protein
VTYEEGKILAGRLGINVYLECSALTHVGLDEIIPTAIRTAVSENSTKQESSFWFLGKRIFSRRNTAGVHQSNGPQPPTMPPAG